MKDDSSRHVLAELSDCVAELSVSVQRSLSLIAESDLNDPAMVTPTERGGLGMSAQWADDVHHAVHAYLTGERQGYYSDFGSLSCLAKAFTRVFIHDGGYSSFRGKDWGKPVPLDMDAHRFVAFASDHDQVGNRAHGDRPAATLSTDKLAMAAAIIFHSPCTPMLFMGEEWGASTPWQFFTDHAEPELADAIRRGRADEFASHGWETLSASTDGESPIIPDPQAHSTFENSRLDWSERATQPHRRLLKWYQDLIALRHTDPEYVVGDLLSAAVDYDEEGGWILFRRGNLWLGIATEEDGVDIPLPCKDDVQLILAWHPEHTSVRHDAKGAMVLRLPGFSAAFVQLLIPRTASR